MGSGRSVGIAARLCCVTRSCDTSIGREFTGKAPVSSSEAWALGRNRTGACWHYRWHSDSSAAAPKTPTTSLRWRPVTFREVFVKHRGFSENVSFGGIVSPVRSTSDSVTPVVQTDQSVGGCNGGGLVTCDQRAALPSPPTDKERGPLSLIARAPISRNNNISPEEWRHVGYLLIQSTTKRIQTALLTCCAEERGGRSERREVPSSH